MSQVCMVTGKKPQVGHRVSHSNIKTKHRFNVNLRKKRFWVDSENRYVTLRVSNHGLRIIDKKGIETVLTDIKKRVTGEI